MELFDLEECPKCRGVGMIMEEGGWNVFSRSNTLVNIPESQSWRELTDQQV